MQEHIRNLRLGWVGFGWFIAVSITSLILLALDAAGVVATDSAAESLWVALALVIGFLLAGFFVGTRVAAAPLIHGVAMGLFSLAAWFLINLMVGEATGAATWRSLPAGTLLGMLSLQMAAAVVGARAAVRWMRSP